MKTTSSSHSVSYRQMRMLFNKHAAVTGTNNRRMSIAEAALEVDLVAYPKLTDMLVETRLLLMS